MSMHADRSQVEARIDRMLDRRVRPALYARTFPLTVSAWTVPGEPVPVEEALTAHYEPFAIGTRWGRPWSTTWFRVSGDVPGDWVGQSVEAVIDVGFSDNGPGFQAEALVYDLAGIPVKALHPKNQYVPVEAASPDAGSGVAGARVEWLVEAAANPEVHAVGAGSGHTDLGSRSAGTGEPQYVFARADLAVLDQEVYGLVLDLEVLRELMHALALDDSRRHEIRIALDRACDLIDLDDVAGSAAAARSALVDVLSRPASASAHTVHAVGHAHIDTAWLWPLRETERKVSRTFANVVALAAQHPDFVFACSQAAQYQWVKDRWPETYKKMQSAAEAGSWRPVGGMWVESDGNLPGGEALARQFVHGQRFFRDEFGSYCTGAWLPDSFGYTAAYPQLAALAGLRWFLTQKISWNKTNRFPHHTFWWEGLDGTRIFTHFPPVDTYNAEVTGAELLRSVRNHSDAGRATRSLLPYGFGDGGGGPTREMLGRIERFADLEGVPRVIHSTPEAFFEAAQAEYPEAPVWTGELYLEMHRGTYTSQARGKAGNRRSEHLMREAELWATAAAVHCEAPYPYTELDRLWKRVLLLQFHDILPGSSIRWVHEEAEQEYEQIAAAAAALISAAQQVLAGDEETVFSASPRSRTAVVTAPRSGDRVAVALPPSSAVRLSEAVARADEARLVPVQVSGSVESGDLVLDNGLLRVGIDADGLLSSVRDLKADREVLAPGSRGNLLRLHTDLPNTYDAWDVDRHYLHRYVDLTAADLVTVTAQTPIEASVLVRRSFGGSTLEQTLTLSAGDPGLQITSVADWHEREKFLKAGFELDLRSPRSTAEVQFGHVERPNHVNTSWDHARFEVSAHRWVRVAETGYGVALLTDATYGYDTSTSVRPGGGTTTTLRVSLLRAPLSPDPEADQGRHVQRYTLLPGADLPDAVAGGYALNLPPRVTEGQVAEGIVGTAGGPSNPFVDTEGDAVVVEAVKLADDRSGDVVVRLYESLGGQARTVLRPAFAVVSAESDDLLERPLGGDSELTVAADSSVPLFLRPFQVLTIRLRRP
jgi:alpha-mannosidase